MSFVTRAFGGGDAARERKRAARAAEAQRAERATTQARIAEESRVAEEAKLAEAQRLEGIETKKAEELKFATQERGKRKLRRRRGGGTIQNVGGPTGLGTPIQGKTFLGT